MNNMQRLALCVALVFGGMATFFGVAHAQGNNTIIIGKVYQTNGKTCLSPKVLVNAYDSKGALIDSVWSSTTTGAFTISENWTYPDPADQRIKLVFRRQGDSKDCRTMTVLLGPSTTTVIDVTCPSTP